MFGARKGTQENQQSQENSNESQQGQSPARAQQSEAQSPAAPRAPMPAQVSPRRVIDIPSGRRSSASSASSESDRTLRVGKGLSLAGEITSCDVLVVEGKVEAKLSEGKLIEIAETGQFRGSVEIENADIAGRYDGQLVVHGRLTVRATGRVSGMVKYGELEVNAGGQIIGEIQVAGVAQAPSFKNAARFTAADDEQDGKNEQRKSA